MKTDYPDTAYAQFAALHLARIDVVSGDLDAAEAELRWVLTRNPAAEIEQLTQLRLARVIAARGDPAGALEIVTGADAGTYAPAYAEAEGDFHQQLGDREAAVSAYERALSLAAATSVGASETLRLKLNALSPVPAREIAALEE
jgi:predicted negative regulator of RcsB-dependent stress response